MPTFIWKGRTASGATASGELAAGSQTDVVAALRQKKIIPTSIKVKEEKKGLTLFGSRVSRHALSVFTRQFSTMLKKCSRPEKFFKVKSYRCYGKTEKSLLNPYKAPRKCHV